MECVQPWPGFSLCVSAFSLFLCHVHAALKPSLALTNPHCCHQTKTQIQTLNVQEHFCTIFTINLLLFLPDCLCLGYRWLLWAYRTARTFLAAWDSAPEYSLSLDSSIITLTQSASPYLRNSSTEQGDKERLVSDMWTRTFHNIHSFIRNLRNKQEFVLLYLLFKV